MLRTGRPHLIGRVARVSEQQPPLQNFGDYYREIYARGMLANELPKLPVSWEGLERAAEEAMDPRAAAYVFGAAGGEETMRAKGKSQHPETTLSALISLPTPCPRQAKFPNEPKNCRATNPIHE